MLFWVLVFIDSFLKFLSFEKREVIKMIPDANNMIFSIILDIENLFSGVDGDLGESVFVSGELSCSDMGSPVYFERIWS